MNDDTAPLPETAPVPDHRITDHDGIVDIRAVPQGQAVEIAFDPARLSEDEVRRIAAEHIQPVRDGLRRFALRLDGEACEAAAAKLERRVEKVPGVRRATATYVGRVLSMTFDAGLTEEDKVLEGVRGVGAKVERLEAKPLGKRPPFWTRARAGDLNEELACAVGSAFLAAALLAPGAGAILYTGAYLFLGLYGVRSALASLREKTLDVDLLMVLAALGAALVGAPFEGALLLFLFSFSNVLQRYAMDRTQRAIESLLTLRPDQALVKRPDGNILVRVEELVPGDVVVVRPGELMPVDGVVAEGRSSLDEASLTGESMPVSKTVGDAVFAGTLNQSGGLEVTVRKSVEDSTLARMVKLVAEAQAEKSHAQRFLEQAEQIYAAVVILLTLAAVLVPWLLLGEDFAKSFYRAMTLMVVASPCALVISTPATVLSAIGGAARRGILIKGGSHLERAAHIDTVVFDKTGTLTVGKPSVTGIVMGGTIHEPGKGTLPPEALRLLALCASLEAKSEHPLATAILTGARQQGADLLSATDFQSIAGKGAEATVDGERLVVGSPRLFAELRAEGLPAYEAAANALQAQGKTCVWMGRREAGRVVILAVFALADTLRPQSRSIVAALHAVGVKKVIMLTGDQKLVAQAIAAEAGLDGFEAELLPEDKVQAIRELKKGGKVLMVGDGVNDAPALAASDLGVAMGAAGTDIAMETADVVLMGDRLENIPLLLAIARQARRVLWQNMIFASSVILVLVAVALGWSLPLPLGVVGHEGSTVLVCLNGLRLLVFRPSFPTPPAHSP